jgi:uncharacterized membrane protein YsdA (DUF1294 family)
MRLALAWLCVANLLAFWMFAADKRAAVAGSPRTRESSLLLISLLGGSPGAYAAQEIFRHKTRKQSFRTRFWMVVAFQAVCSLGWIALGLPLPA